MMDLIVDDLQQVEWSEVRDSLSSIEGYATQLRDHGYTNNLDYLCDLADDTERQVRKIRDLIGYRAG